MSKGQKRSNREAKKPKQQKQKPVASTLSAAMPQAKPTAAGRSGRK